MSRAVKKEYNHHLDRRAAAILKRPEASAGPDNELLDSVYVANWVEHSSVWVHQGRIDGYGPEFEQLTSTKVGYRRGAVKEWLRDRAKRWTKRMEPA